MDLKFGQHLLGFTGHLRSWSKLPGCLSQSTHFVFETHSLDSAVPCLLFVGSEIQDALSSDEHPNWYCFRNFRSF